MIQMNLTNLCQYNIWNNSSEMPPKRSKKSQTRTSANEQPEVVAIEQHFRKAGDNDEVGEVLKRLEIAYNSNKKSLVYSVIAFIMRACGLSAGLPHLDFNNLNASITSIFELIEQKKLKSVGDQIITVSRKDKAQEKYVQKIKIFLSKLLCEDFEFMKNEKSIHLLSTIQECINILSKQFYFYARSKFRQIRLSAILLMKILIQSQTQHFTAYINRKQSKKALQYLKDVETYLPIIKERVKDSNYQIRQNVQECLKGILIAMQTNIADEKIIEDVFLSCIKDSNPKIVEETLQNLLHIIQKSKMMKKLMFSFVRHNIQLFENLSYVPNQGGVYSLKLLIECHKMSPQQNILNPAHISKVFEYYGLQDYTIGLQAAIDAFYNSIYSTSEELIKNKLIVAIQIMNLINNFPDNKTKKKILLHFSENPRVAFEDIISIEDLFVILLSEQYNINDNLVQLKEKDLVGLLIMIDIFMENVKKNINKYEKNQNNKYQKERQHWKQIGQAFNTHLLTNIKTFIHDKMGGQLTGHYLKLMGKITFPIASSFENYIDYMYERIVIMFEKESNIEILEKIVDIFANNKNYNIDLLTKNANFIPRNKKEEVLRISKRITILRQFYVQNYTSQEFLKDILQEFKQINDEQLKLNMFLGLYLINQWNIDKIMKTEEENMQQDLVSRYKYIRISIIEFFFSVIAGREHSNVKFAALNFLFRILEIVSHSQVEEIQEIYYEINNDEINIIFNFLNDQIGLPILQRQNNQNSIDYSRLLGALSLQDSFSKEKILEKLYKILESNIKIASNKICLRFILGALQAQTQKQQNNQQSFTRQNISMTNDIIDNRSSFEKNKYSSKFFEKIIDKEIRSQNASKFFFWKLVDEIEKQFEQSPKILQKIINKLIDIYFQKKISNAEFKKTRVSKAFMYVIYKIDNIFQQSSFKSINFLLGVMKKLQKRSTKHIFQRVYQFVKEKPKPQASAEIKSDFQNFLAYLQKASKTTSNNQQKDEQGSSDQQNGVHAEEKSQLNQEQIMRNQQNRRQTRNSSRKIHS